MALCLGLGKIFLVQLGPRLQNESTHTVLSAAVSSGGCLCNWLPGAVAHNMGVADLLLPAALVLQGRTVSFKNTLVLLTSNIGSRVIAASGGGGLAAFGSRRDMIAAGVDDEEADERIIKSEQVSSGGLRPGQTVEP